MKKIFLAITLFSILAILPVNNFAQTNCNIEPGIGCGKFHLGMTKAEIKSILGEGKQDSHTNSLNYENLGLVIRFDSTDRINSIFFVINPKVWGGEKYTAFSGSLPKNLSFQTNPSQLTQFFGNPQEQAVYGEVTMIKFQGIEFGFRNKILMCVEVNKSEQIVVNNEVKTETQPQKAESPKPTPTPKTVVAKTKNISDCKLILSEGCREFFLQSTINEIRSQLKNLRENSSELFKAEGLELTVEPSSDGIIAVTFYKSSGWKPNNNLKWGEGMTKISEKYVGGAYRRQAFGEILTYSNFVMTFYDGDLTGIVIERPRTETELAAYNIREGKYAENKAASERAEAEREARKTPQEKAAEIERKKQQMETDYKELLNQLDAKLREGERIVNSEKIAIAAGGMFKQAVQNKLDKVRAAGESLIDSFGKKYQGMIPVWMVKGIQEKWTGQ